MNSYIAHIDTNGRVCIPSLLRKELGLMAGSAVLISSGAGEIRISTYKQKLEKARSIVKKYTSGRSDLSDELRILRQLDRDDEKNNC